MEILFNKESLFYQGNNLEAPYRLRGIDKIGKLVSPNLDEKKLLELIHPSRYISKIEQSCRYKQSLAEILTSLQTFDAAKKAASTAVYAAKSENFAAIRPPGHHASRETPAGFCLFNNIAIATQALLNEGKRVCILDIDGHHGDGTERIFNKDGRVLFWSIYQSPVHYTNPEFYDRLLFDKTHLRKGEGKARGLIHNIPLKKGSRDKDLIYEIDRFVPMIKTFNPDYIGISAGFDGYHKDALLNLAFTQQGYQEFGKIVGSLGKKTFGVLEGGYHQDVVSCIDYLVKGINSGKEVSKNERFSCF